MRNTDGEAPAARHLLAARLHHRGGRPFHVEHPGRPVDARTTSSASSLDAGRHAALRRRRAHRDGRHRRAPTSCAPTTATTPSGATAARTGSRVAPATTSLNGGDGDDILTDAFGDDNIKGGDGNDAINAGSGFDLLLAGAGDDFIVRRRRPEGDLRRRRQRLRHTPATLPTRSSVTRATTGSRAATRPTCSRAATATRSRTTPRPATTSSTGEGGNDDYDSEGGDDIMVTGAGIERLEGMLGFDWVDPQGRRAAGERRHELHRPSCRPDEDTVRDRFDMVEGLSGWTKNDILRGDSRDATAGRAGAEGTSTATSSTTSRLIDGLQAVLGAGVTQFTGGQHHPRRRRQRPDRGPRRQRPDRR